jgi:hypothetical protein
MCYSISHTIQVGASKAVDRGSRRKYSFCPPLSSWDLVPFCVVCNNRREMWYVAESLAPFKIPSICSNINSGDYCIISVTLFN